jgi:hypothetical protein
MDAVAYIDPKVISFINNNVIPLRLQASDPVLGLHYKIKWTPSLLILDADGTEHYRTLGFYPPEDLIPSILLGMGKAKFNLPDRTAASKYFEKLVADYPKNSLSPEAVFMNGVSKFIEDHEVGRLIEIYDRLKADYHDSPWLTRADPYRLLKN